MKSVDKSPTSAQISPYRTMTDTPSPIPLSQSWRVCLCLRAGAEVDSTAFQLIRLYLLIHLYTVPIMDRSFLPERVGCKLGHCSPCVISAQDDTKAYAYSPCEYYLFPLAYTQMLAQTQTVWLFAYLLLHCACAQQIDCLCVCG